MKISRDWRDIWPLNFVKKYGCNDNIFSFEAGIWVPKTIECGEASGSSRSLPPLLEIVDSDNPGMKMLLLCNILVHAVHIMTEHASWYLIMACEFIGLNTSFRMCHTGRGVMW